MNGVCFGPNCVKKLGFPRFGLRKRIYSGGCTTREFCSLECLVEYAKKRMKLE